MPSDSRGSSGDVANNAATQQIDEGWVAAYAGERFEVLRALGQTSGSRVFLCTDEARDGELVALKILPPSVIKDPVLLERFFHEVETASRVDHPNVVRLFDVICEGEFLGYTCEYIDNGNLFEWRDKEKSPRLSEVVSILKQLASGLQAIHDAGVIHRDLKLENILLTDKGTVKISDFGVSLSVYGKRLTPLKNVLGTPAYVSPEYIDRGKLDTRSDIYALGIIGYELICGKLPFEDKSVLRTMMMRVSERPRPPHEVRSECPLELSAIIMRSLETSESMRYQWIQEFAADLDTFSQSLEGELLNARGLSRIFKLPFVRRLRAKLPFILELIVCALFILYAYGFFVLQNESDVPVKGEKKPGIADVGEIKR